MTFGVVLLPVVEDEDMLWWCTVCEEGRSQ